MLPIVLYPDKRLLQECIPVEVSQMNDELKTFMNAMLESMYHHNGIGLAAPQVGKNIRMIVIDIDKYLREEKVKVDQAFATLDKSKLEALEVMKKSEDFDKVLHNNKPLFMINPEIVSKSKDFILFEEGCLSLPEIRGKVRRHRKIKVKFYDENGVENLIAPPEGILTVCIQHEIDHINGILFIDHLSRLQKEFLLKKMFKKMSKAEKVNKE